LKIIDKEILKTARNFVTYKETYIRLLDFSAESLHARREWDDISKVLKENMPHKNIVIIKAIY
jgi:predicted transcriptional regulator